MRTAEGEGHDHDECAHLVQARRDAIVKALQDLRTGCEEEMFGESLVNRFVMVSELVDASGNRYLTITQDGSSEQWDVVGLLHGALDAVRTSDVW